MGKCVHKGCGKTFADAEEDCVYHPGPPVFHEGQKGQSRYLACCELFPFGVFDICELARLFVYLDVILNSFYLAATPHSYKKLTFAPRRLEMLQTPRLNL